MLGFVLMILAISQLSVQCRKAGFKAAGPMLLLLGTWLGAELISMAILYYLGVIPRIANFVSMLIGVLGGGIAYLSILRGLPKNPKK